MDETYRLLGREHELDLEREARKRHLAAEAEGGPAKAQVEPERQERASFLPRQLVALLRLAASLR